MLVPMTDRQQVMIVNNVRKVIKEKNIELLSKQAHNYLYLCSGFIAHYNYHGFKDYYQNVDDLKTDLLVNYNANMWNNFHPTDRDYEYMMAKKAVYQNICKGLE